MDKIPFSPPRIDQKIIDEVTNALKSGWITTGPRTKEFEKRISQYVGSKSTLCLNSATAGLEVILRWFGVQEGDEVILPAYTYSATANVIMHCGATPVFVDVDNDFNISVEAIQQAITTRTKVIMPVDFGGLPCEYAQINELVAKPELKQLFVARTEEQKALGRILILSDAAHSIGASYRGRMTGSIADVSVFSFHAVKNLTTAEGGAVCLNLPEGFDNEAVYKYLCVKTLHGQNKDALAKMQPGAWRYDIIEPGYKCNMTDIMAAIGLVELERYESETLPRRKKCCELYTELLSQYDWAIAPVQKTHHSESSYHLYPLRIKDVTEAQRDEVIAKISERGISVNVHFIPVPMMSFYKNCGYDIRHYPNTFQLYASEISLPVYYDLTEEQITYIVKTIAEVVAVVKSK